MDWMWLPFTAAAFPVLVGSIGPPSCVLSAPVMGWTADWPPGLMASGLSLCSLHFRFCGCDGCVFSGPHRIRGSYGTRTLRRRGSAVRYRRLASGLLWLRPQSIQSSFPHSVVSGAAFLALAGYAVSFSGFLQPEREQQRSALSHSVLQPGQFLLHPEGVVTSAFPDTVVGWPLLLPFSSESRDEQVFSRDTGSGLRLLRVSFRLWALRGIGLRAFFTWLSLLSLQSEYKSK